MLIDFQKLTKNLNKNKINQNLPITIYQTQKNLMNDLIPRNQILQYNSLDS